MLRLTPLAVVAALLAAAPAQAQTAPDGTPSDEAALAQVVADAVTLGEGITREQAFDEIRARLEGSELDAFDSRFASAAALARSTDGGADGAFAIVRQDGSGNAFNITQAGPGNVLVLVQQGLNNEAALVQQGAENVIGLFVQGDANASQVQQQGDGNVYLLEFAGESLQHAVVQVGNDNQAVQLGTGTVPFSIEQYGDGMELTIEHN